MENAVATGARTGVKVKYWIDSGDDEFQDPREIAKEMVQEYFWLNKLEKKDIEVNCKDSEKNTVDVDEDYQYLEVIVKDFVYNPLTGYLPKAMIPQKIGAFSLMSFP
ncbi:MAG: hypothetical protein K8S13_08145 [Desulfobacula sp.]|uniref:hypothetical protein n=1 Tax=Desulfobacula sp. TaxID=2593537 RepID=UPI0025BA6183|nr:hypothetical protein [Desulfobacula sp.]MCD4719817.1 hypothetical protein [Desulfobacula sp.]